MGDGDEVVHEMDGAKLAPPRPFGQARTVEAGVTGIEPEPAAPFEPVAQVPSAADRQ
jgi:hypothetical protein